MNTNHRLRWRRLAGFTFALFILFLFQSSSTLAQTQEPAKQPSEVEQLKQRLQQLEQAVLELKGQLNAIEEDKTKTATPALVEATYSETAADPPAASGEVASLQDQALDRILDFAAEVGLVVLIHNDVDVPFAKPGAAAAYPARMKALLKRHPKTTLIWAHIGVGRIIRPVKEQAAIVEGILSDPELKNVYFDISWDEVAKYIVSTPESMKNTATMVNRYPDRFLFGTDEVAPPNQEKYFKIYNQYEPFWKLLTNDASEKIRKGNYERIFDDARRSVRSWEATNVKSVSSITGGLK